MVDFQFQPQDLLRSSPQLILLGMGLVLMLADALGAMRSLRWLAGVGLVASMVAVFPGVLGPQTLTTQLGYSGMVAFGGTAAMVHLFLCVAGLASLFFIEDYFKRYGQMEAVGEVYALLLFAVLGMVMMGTANDLIVVFIGLEVFSICLYIMAGMFKRDLKSNEAGMKYFLLGAFSTGFFLYGIALLYGISGTTQLDQLDPEFMVGGQRALLFYAAMALLLIGFLFKVAAFPFHNWTPDVYTGAPTALVGFMATGGKLAAFVALANLLGRLTPSSDEKLLTLISLLAVASMVYGNIVAARQSNVKRLLAYSSIAHTGYLLLGIAAGPIGYPSVVFYMFIYTLMTVGAFGVVAAVENTDGDAELERWRGLGLRRPLLGAAMSAFLFSLAGIPPLAGFMGKYQVFLSAIEADLVLLATVGVLTSVIGAYYYLRVIVVMYFGKEATAGTESAPRQWAPVTGALLLALLLLFFGLFPNVVTGLLQASTAAVAEAGGAVLP